MLEIKGMQAIKSKKNGKDYMLLHLLDDAVVDVNGFKGQSVAQEFVDIDNVEIQGKLDIGAKVRIFKENKNGFDQISLIMVTK